MGKHIDIKGALKFGWEKFKTYWVFSLLAMALVYAVSIAQGIVDRAYEDNDPVSIILSILFSLITAFFYFNAVRVIIRVIDGQVPKINELFQYSQSYWYYVLGAIIYGIIVGFGLVLFIIPGLYFMIRFGQYLYAIADRGLGPIEALKESSRLTYGVRWELFLFCLVCLGIALAGVILFVVGLLVAVPVIAFASAYIYRELTNQTREPVPVAVVHPEPTSGELAPAVSPSDKKEAVQ